MRVKKHSTEKLHWKSLPKNARLFYDSGTYYWDGAMVYWMGEERIEAQRFLNSRVR